MLAAVAVEISVAQMLKLDLRFVKVSVAVVVAGAGLPFWPALNDAKKLYSFVSKCVKVFLFSSFQLLCQIVAEDCTCCLLLLPEK